MIHTFFQYPCTPVFNCPIKSPLDWMKEKCKMESTRPTALTLNDDVNGTEEPHRENSTTDLQDGREGMFRTSKASRKESQDNRKPSKKIQYFVQPSIG